MDKAINVRLFSVETKEAGGLSFSTALQNIGTLGLELRERQIEEDIIVRLERLERVTRVLAGEFVRLQTTNLPPKVARGQPLESLGVRAIGHSAAFAYDMDLSVMALQMSRNGITPSRIGLYSQELASGPGFDILPVPNGEVLAAVRRGGVRGLMFRVAMPNELRAIDNETQSVRRGMIEMKRSLQPARIEIGMTMKRGDVDMDRRRTLAFIGWLQRERQERRGEVSKIAARIAPDEGEAAETLNLLGGQLGDRRTIDLPEDDPQTSYRLRSAYVLQVLRDSRRTLEGMYGG